MPFLCINSPTMMQITFICYIQGEIVICGYTVLYNNPSRTPSATCPGATWNYLRDGVMYGDVIGHWKLT